MISIFRVSGSTDRVAAASITLVCGFGLSTVATVIVALPAYDGMGLMATIPLLVSIPLAYDLVETRRPKLPSDLDDEPTDDTNN